MPLPPLLAERLRRRNILKNEERIDNSSTQHDSSEAQINNHAYDAYMSIVSTNNLEAQDQEEVFAEDYSDDEDDDDDGNDNIDSADSSSRAEHLDDNESADGEEDEEIINHDFIDEQSSKEESVETVLGCPNKYNLYHRCSRYCQERNSNPRLEPTKSQLKLLAIILRHFPINSDWKPIYEPGVKTFYFWNTITDQVTWLPFSHPNANITQPVDIVRKMMIEQENSQ